MFLFIYYVGAGFVLGRRSLCWSAFLTCVPSQPGGPAWLLMLLGGHLGERKLLLLGCDQIADILLNHTLGSVTGQRMAVGRAHWAAHVCTWVQQVRRFQKHDFCFF